MKKYIVRTESKGILNDITLNASDTLIYISLLERNSIWFAVLCIVNDKQAEAFFTLKQFEKELNK